MAITSRWNNATYNPGGGNRLSLGIGVQVIATGPLFERGTEIVANAIDDAARAAAQHGAPIIQAKTPVDTGLLRSSWTAADNRIYNAVPYSIFVEWGTYKMAPRAMARKSLPEIQQYFVEQLVDRLRELG